MKKAKKPAIGGSAPGGKSNQLTARASVQSLQKDIQALRKDTFTEFDKVHAEFDKVHAKFKNIDGEFASVHAEIRDMSQHFHQTVVEQKKYLETLIQEQSESIIESIGVLIIDRLQSLEQRVSKL